MQLDAGMSPAMLDGGMMDVNELAEMGLEGSKKGNHRMNDLKQLLEESNIEAGDLDASFANLEHSGPANDNTLGDAVLDGLKDMKVEIENTYEQMISDVRSLKEKPKDELSFTDLMELQVQTGSFTFVMTMTSGITQKSTGHLDTLLKAQ